MRRRALPAAALAAWLLAAAGAQAAPLDPALDIASVHSPRAPLWHNITYVPVGGGGRRAARGRAAAGDLPYAGGSVMHSNRTYAVYWQPAGSGLSFDPGYTQQVDTFLGRVAHDSHQPGNVYGITGQYTDAGGPAVYDSSFGGGILDTDPLPPRDPLCQEPAAPPLDTGPGWAECVSDAQIQEELKRVAAAHGIRPGLRNILFLVTPNGLGDCFTSTVPARCALGGSAHNGYCGYHDATDDGLLYAVVPYNAVAGHCQSDAPRPNASPSDPSLSTLSHEHNEVITDPLGNAWIDAGGNENGDLCMDEAEYPPPALGGSGAARYDQVIGGGHYWLQLEWSNQEGGCVAQDEADRLALALPRHAAAGARLTLRARGSDPDGSITDLLWTFGDRHTARGAAPRHAFRRAGRYRIVVRATDVAGNWTYTTAVLRVSPPRKRGSGGQRHGRRAGRVTR